MWLVSEWQNPSLERNEVKEIICIPVRIQVAPYRLLWGERSRYMSLLYLTKPLSNYLRNKVNDVLFLGFLEFILDDTVQIKTT